MSYKSRVQGAAQEILFCRVKDLNGPRTKELSMAYETYLVLRKEMEIEILSIIQKGKPEAYKSRLSNITGRDAKLPSQRNEFPMHGSTQKPSQNKKTYLPEDEGEIPEPPVQNKQRLPGEEKKEFHVRRMKEGKAYKKWEAKYGEAYAGKRSAESVSESQATRDGRASEAEEAGADPMRASGDEAADIGDAGAEHVPDPIKEAIEKASFEELMKQNQ